MHPYEDAPPSDSPRILALFRRMIVKFGVARSVIAMTLTSLAMSLAGSALLRTLLGSGIEQKDVVVAALLPMLIAPPLAWMGINLISRLDRSERAQQHLATHDSLTELCNRREFFQRMARVHERAHREGRPAWLLMLDLDRFKAINDECGHLAGDRAIRQVADLCRAETRPGDVLGRYGGDEFALVVVGLDREAAGSIAARLRQRITATPLILSDGRRLALSTSIGLAALVSPDSPGLTLDRSIGQADDALREAKRLGRDRICVAAGERCEPLAA
ncbi:GGDEF domain-containing protein [Burkholderiaceae bacterium FT117]|uniref:GGDEF domain-containing protein n=1 Tax=Zeimonas sediminis TaxID=2944268 RepID=UPI0023431986|nr:GGDEF domain-containing protein [Zeimonas sediminis]MCM5569536.1 GGDEF domain-containing protein [Zeimonas sediminis]